MSAAESELHGTPSECCLEYESNSIKSVVCFYAVFQLFVSIFQIFYMRAKQNCVVYTLNYLFSKNITTVSGPHSDLFFASDPESSKQGVYTFFLISFSDQFVCAVSLFSSCVQAGRVNTKSGHAQLSQTPKTTHRPRKMQL